MNYLRYSPSVEKREPDEQETFDKIADTFIGLGMAVRENEGRAMRVSHAKSTGLLKGELIVDGDLLQRLRKALPPPLEPIRRWCGLRRARGKCWATGYRRIAEWP